MKTIKLKSFCGTKFEPKKSVSNNYDTKPDDFVHPLLYLNIGVRNSGKSYHCSTMVNQFMADRLYDACYVICPTWISNKCYYEAFCPDENVFEPYKGAITDVVGRVEEDRDDWDDFLNGLLEYEKSKNLDVNALDDFQLFHLYELGLLDDTCEIQRPVWKYETERPPQSLVIMDDILGSRAIGPELTRLGTLSRHIAPLNIKHKLNKQRTACGLSIIINSQTYRMPSGVGRCLRENITVLNTFENKSPTILKVMVSELCSCVAEEDFYAAYEKAIQKKHDCLTVDFFPRQPQYRFRKNLKELILIEENDVKNEIEFSDKKTK